MDSKKLLKKTAPFWFVLPLFCCAYFLEDPQPLAPPVNQLILSSLRFRKPPDTINKNEPQKKRWLSLEEYAKHLSSESLAVCLAQQKPDPARVLHFKLSNTLEFELTPDPTTPACAQKIPKFFVPEEIFFQAPLPAEPPLTTAPFAPPQNQVAPDPLGCFHAGFYDQKDPTSPENSSLESLPALFFRDHMQLDVPLPLIFVKDPTHSLERFFATWALSPYFNQHKPTIQAQRVESGFCKELMGDSFIDEKNLSKTADLWP
jgi:hypothetical protein